MFNYVLRKIVGTKNQRELKRMQPLVARINEREAWAKSLPDEQIREQVRAWRKEVADTPGLQKTAVLDRILPDCFALTRESSVRALGMRHFDVQLIGGMGLHKGMIAEMKTGEGKTLVATLPCVLNALEGKGVHVVTVNDYLARRDAEWMGRIYRHMGLSVGCVVHGLTDRQRQKEYGSDITYGQNNEFGFDYLRDNMKFRLADYVQRELHYAIVDEVDSILIDEARTPLIISGPSEESTDKYYKINKVIPGLVRDRDFTVDEKARSVVLTDEGVEKVEAKLGVPNLYDPEQIETLHHVEQALRAHTLYRKDHEYVVKDGEVIIVDDFTGRLMPGRRWSDGLHQAVEAKENVKIENENQTLATVSFQNYFRLYSKLAGMTGTADTEAAEFAQIYKLEVLVIPTNKQNIRKDLQDTVYKTEREKFKAVCDDVEERWKKGQPVLVGTVSIAKSEVLSGLLKKRSVPHDVLNAKQHEREAEIVAQAGRKGRITISTNMAGRGTDILLGGNPEFLAKREVGAEPSPVEIEGRLVQARVEKAKAEGDGKFPPVTAAEVEQVYRAEYAAWKERHDAAVAKFKDHCGNEHEEVVALGGLHILGTERHESRRIDNQLRGRSGRQGDPGSSKFYLSLEDDLMRIFASDRIAKLMDTFGVQENEPIEHPWLTKAIQGAQERVEGQNFDIRKNLLEYDDVMNQQRKTIYGMRKEVLASGAGVPLIWFTEDPKTKKKTRHEKMVTWKDQEEHLYDLIEDLIIEMVDEAVPRGKNDEFDTKALQARVREQFNVDMGFEGAAPDKEKLQLDIFNVVEKKLKAKFEALGDDFRLYTQWLYLNTIDQLWKDHLLQMDHLRQGIHLRGYGQKDPKIEYKKEGFELFQIMKGRIAASTVSMVMRVEPVQPQAATAQPAQARASASLPPLPQRRAQATIETHGEALAAAGGQGGTAVQNQTAPIVRAGPRVGRNDPCPCGSGKKYKKCHLPLEEGGARPAES
ncbi:MAG: preprotein translocase subunit SecA [Deltaproteobacteria bacterium 13_1_40CM_3_69_14]|nr:MAG: preprotein translocase subunit SecA [Deltaproteobacteria bacterium 13_1_40CM_3_69_14]